MRSFRFAVVALFVAAATPAFSGATSVPFDFTPDPALKTASRGELEARVRRACVVVQARQRGVSETAMTRPCACYARQTLRAFTPIELQAYRDTGVFNETGRAKAQAALSDCLSR